jgi:hypothetical protein
LIDDGFYSFLNKLSMIEARRHDRDLWKQTIHGIVALSWCNDYEWSSRRLSAQ